MNSPQKHQPIPLKDVVDRLYRQLDEREWRDDGFWGELTVKTQEVGDFLVAYLADDQFEDHPCRLDDGDPHGLKIGDHFRFRFGAVRGGLGLVLRDANALLSRSDILRGTSSSDWYLVCGDIASWEQPAGDLAKLPSIRGLVAHLEKAAAIFDQRVNALVFLREKRFDVQLACTTRDLRELDLTSLDSLLSELDRDDGHTKQRNEIMATAVFDMTQNELPAERFGALLRQIEDLRQRVVDGYTLFASSFSFEALRKDVETFYIDHVAKIHKTLSDIQGQLLGVPVSTIVVATQLKPVAADPSNLWINCAVLVGALVFCILLTVSVLNQLHTLGVLDEDVKQKQASLRDTGTGLEERLGGRLEKLRTRIVFHLMALKIVVAAAGVGLLIAFGVFWQLSRDAI